MMCRLYIIVVSIERCAHGRPTWKYTEKGAYNKSLANLILSCIYASHCYQHQFSSSPFYNNAASCAAALLLIKAAFSARSPIARLTPAKYLMRGDASQQERRESQSHPARVHDARYVAKSSQKESLKRMNVKKSKSTFKWCVCADVWWAQESMNMYNHAKSLTKGHKTTWKTFQTSLVKKYTGCAHEQTRDFHVITERNLKLCQLFENTIP